MNEHIKYLNGWDNFNSDLYLRYLEVKFLKEEDEFLNKRVNDKEWFHYEEEWE